MRVTDNRYAAEMAKFNLAVRMIGHEARTGTIRACTGFSEDRIRKIYGTYFKCGSGQAIRRRRGKTPTQITPFISSSLRQSEATVLACLFMCAGILELQDASGAVRQPPTNSVQLGEALCDAYETYRQVHPQPGLCFEKTWTLYNALARQQELYFARCAACEAPYVQDRYALDYQRCPFCDLKATD